MVCEHTPATYNDETPVLFSLPRVPKHNEDNLKWLTANVCLCTKCWQMYVPDEPGVHPKDSEKGHWLPQKKKGKKKK